MTSAQAATDSIADPGAPNPGSPGTLAFPALKPGTFATPPAAARVKFRWWQPLADTNDAEIQREVAAMAGNFGGGFEQNGFAVSNGPNTGRPARCEGCTPQFYSFAASQQFGQQYGWGSPLWSRRTAAYQQAAALNGVIGDMNEGSRWDNQVPTVYGPNQPADAQDLSYGVRQYQPGADPSGELPPVTAPALGGESTVLSVAANPGESSLQVQSVAGLLAGDQITLGQGSAAESATIKNVGTPSAVVPLSQAASAGSRVVHVEPADTTTGVPGDPQAAAELVPGEDVTIGSDADRETGTIASIGTYDMTPDVVPYTSSPVADWIWNTLNSADSAAPGTIYLRKTFITPTGVSSAHLSINADDAEFTYINGKQVASSQAPNWPVTQSVDITKDVNPAGSENVIAVAVTNGGANPSAAGAIVAVQIDGSNATRIVTDPTWKAWPASTANPPVSPVPPADNWNTAAFDDSTWDNASSAGAFGIAPWRTQAGAGQPGPTTLVLPPGGSGTVAAAAGATNVEVASNANFLRGDTVTIGSGAASESRTITSVGGAGGGTTLSGGVSAGDLQVSVASASGLQGGQYITIGSGTGLETDRIATVSGKTLTLYTPLQQTHATSDPVGLKSIGVSFTPALSGNHAVGETAIDTGTGIMLSSALKHDHAPSEAFLAAGTGVTLTAPLTKIHAAGANDAVATTLSSAAVAGARAIKVASVANLGPGDQLTVGHPGYTETVTVQDVGTAGPTGTGVTFTPALANFHYSGDPVTDATEATVTNASGGLSDIERESLVSAELVQCLPPNSADNQAGSTTSLSAATAAGATTMKVRSAANLAVGDQLTVGTGSGGETRTITAISGTTIILASALDNEHGSGQGVWDTCTTAATGGTRELDPATTIDVTKDVTANKLNWTEGALHYTGGTLPVGNGQPWELIGFYLHGDTQSDVGGTATGPNQWLGHLSVASAKAMTDYFDGHILNDPATQAAIAYQDTHTGTPAVFEDSLENANNLNWVPDMVASWNSDLGYNPTSLLPALAATGRNATATPAFDFPQSDGQGATLGWRVRDDYGQMWNDLYINRYVKTIDSWASSRGLVARFQSYGDPIDEGDAAANEGIAETEHYEFAGADETQQFKIAASGTYQNSSPHLVSNECCEAQGQVWADPFGLDGTGSGASPAVTEPNAESVYADQAGGDTQIIYHGWPYTTGAAGSRALWPGNSYGGNDTYSAANGPNQPQFADDRTNNIAVARHSLVLRQGKPRFDVAVFHEDFGLGGQGQDNLTNGWNMGTVTAGGVTTRPTSGKILRSSSSLEQTGYLYGYVSPAFFRYPTATFAVDPQDGSVGKVLFPGHGDYRSLVLYDQSVLPIDVANKIVALAGQGLPIVIIGQVPDAAPNAVGGTVAGMQAADQQVQAAMAKVVASPNTVIVADATSSASQSADANAPAALASLGVSASTQLNAPSAVNASGVATPLQGIRRHDNDIDYYQLFNSSATTTARASVTLTGRGTPYLLDAWTGKITPIANYTAVGNRVTMSLRIAPGNASIVALTPSNNVLGAKPNLDVHATGTTANATPEGVDNVVYNSSGHLVARAAATGTYQTMLSDGTTVTSNITVPAIDSSSTVSVIDGQPTLTNWQLSVDSWTQTPSGDPTKTLHTPIPASGSFNVTSLTGVTNGTLPSWTGITPQNIPGLDPANNLTNIAGIGTYTTSFTLPADWSINTAGVYLNVGSAIDTVDIWVNGKAVSGVDENDRNQVDIGPYLQPGANQLKISVATPLRNAVAVAPATPATGQVPNSAEAIGDLQEDVSPCPGPGPCTLAPGFTSKLASVGLIGPVTLTPYGQSTPLN